MRPRTSAQPTRRQPPGRRGGGLARGRDRAAAVEAATGHPFWDQDRVHDIYRSWRKVADSYADTPEGKRIFVSEAWVPDPQRLANYVRPDELNTTFNFDFLMCPWDATHFKRTIDEQIAMHALVGAPVTWVVSNHDVTRHLTRYGRPAGTSPVRRVGAGRPRPRPRRGPARWRCSCWRCRAAVTSTWVRNSGCGRSRTFPTIGAAGPDVEAVGRKAARPRRLPGAAAVERDGGALRIRDRSRPHRGCRSRRSSPTSPPRRRLAIRRRCCPCTATRCASGENGANSATAR